MTCIVGVLDKKNDCVYMGADSLASNWLSKQLIKNKKIIRAKDNKNILMAVSGSPKLLNFLSVEEEFIEEIKELKNEVNVEHIIKYTVPRIIDLAKKYYCLIDKSGEITIQGHIIFAYKNQLYLIESDGMVFESKEEYVAAGSGITFALGVLSQNKNKSTTERIIEALVAAEKHGNGVERPFYIMNTKNDEIVEIK